MQPGHIALFGALAVLILIITYIGSTGPKQVPVVVRDHFYQYAQEEDGEEANDQADEQDYFVEAEQRRPHVVLQEQTYKPAVPMPFNL